jgi:histidinol dehydrogenase
VTRLRRSATSARLARREFIQKILTHNGWLIQVKDLAAAVVLANRLAPEHCEVMTRDGGKLSQGLLTSGAIFVGGYSPTVLGDYVAGPSHVLPTGGAARSFAGLTVDQFQRRTSVVEYGKPALKKALKAVKMFAALEGLDAHGRSAEVRLE